MVRPKPQALLERRPPPLDDPRWRPLTAEHKRLAERDGDLYLAALDLTKELASGKLRYMRRQRATGWKRELGSPDFWTDYELRYFLTTGLEAFPRRPPRSIEIPGENGSLIRVAAPLRSLRGVVFSVWGPDGDKLWPPLEPKSQNPEPEAVASGIRRRKPGPQTKKSWKLHVAVELHRIVIIEGKLPPTAKDLAEFCVGKLKYHPDISEIQKLIKDLL